MKVLIVNTNASSGSIGRISFGLFQYLKSHGHDALVCYRGINEHPVNDEHFIPLVSKHEFNFSVTMARLTGLESHFSYFATRKLKHTLENYNPDIVQLYNLHGNYIRSYNFLEYLKMRDIPVVYSMLDEFPYMGKCAYPLDCVKFKVECKDCPQKGKYPESWFIDRSRTLFHKKEACYNDFKNLVFTGPPYVCQRAKESYLLRKQRVEELYEPFNFSDFFYPRDSFQLRQKLGIKSTDKVVVCASGTYFRKGGHYFLEAARKLQQMENIKFIFIGYSERVGWNFPNNVIVRGHLSNQDDFANYMSLGDVYVCTSVGDTTPSVCLCALGCGTPIIGFDYGGVKDCAPNEFGRYVPVGDVDALAQAIAETPFKTESDIKRIREYAINTFSQESVYNNHLMIFETLVKAKQNDNQITSNK